MDTIKDPKPRHWAPIIHPANTKNSCLYQATNLEKDKEKNALKTSRQPQAQNTPIC